MGRVILFGHYGRGNLGDELLALHYRNLLQEVFPSRERWLITACPGNVPLFTGERTCARFEVPRLLAATGKGDLWLGGGGSLVQNVTSRRSLIYYLSLMACAEARGAKVALLGQGYGPVEGRLWETVARKVLSRISLFECRDELTWQRLRAMGLKEPALLRGVDPVWGYQCNERPVPGEGRLFILRACDASRVRLLLAASAPGASFLRVVALEPSEEKRLRRACGGLFFGVAADLSTFWSAAQGVGSVVSSRLHGLILASLAGLPAVGLGKDPKLTETCRELGLDCFSMEKPAELDLLPEAIAAQAANPSIPERISALRNKALSDKEKLKETLRRLEAAD